MWFYDIQIVSTFICFPVWLEVVFYVNFLPIFSVHPACACVCWEFKTTGRIQEIFEKKSQNIFLSHVETDIHYASEI